MFVPIFTKLVILNFSRKFSLTIIYNNLIPTTNTQEKKKKKH